MKPLRGSGRDSCGISAAAAHTSHRRRGPRAPSRLPSYPMTSRLPRDPDPCSAPDVAIDVRDARLRSEEHTSEIQSLMRISYAVFCLKKKKHDEKDKTHKLRKNSLTKLCTLCHHWTWIHHSHIIVDVYTQHT